MEKVFPRLHAWARSRMPGFLAWPLILLCNFAIGFILLLTFFVACVLSTVFILSLPPKRAEALLREMWSILK